ncbi:MAG: hypothetical protein SCARUB_01595 [Candidatus Scalindua rubra]|uniref:Putative zinc-finger domain-containing protein n=1 Tax=Candidatus Scalindua rubra TaxID=1872076 RepID=A0A1E3XEA2_9BACT|nr:MAG: hypothetical protein SCARUB_01595 [Candidatus Scalindua rubra]
MNCKEARRYINLFFDSELDSKTNFEISEHLSSCEDCNRRFTQEERIEKSFVSILKEDKDPKAEKTWERVISRFNHQAEPREETRLSYRSFPPERLWQAGRRYLVPATIAIIGMIIMLIMYIGQDSDKLTVVAQRCHKEYITNKIVPSIESVSPGEMSRYFSGKFTFPVVVSEIPDIKSHHVKLFGGKVCHLNGISAAYVMYHCCNTPVSVFILNTKDVENFSDMRRYLAGDRMLSKDADGTTFIAVPANQDTCVCVVADHDIELLRWIANNFTKT